MTPRNQWRKPRERVYPFWSPDSQYIGFFAADGKLRKIAAARRRPRRSSWQRTVDSLWWHLGPGRRDRFFLRPPWSLSDSGLGWNGGKESRYRKRTRPTYRWPSFLPDGKHVLVTSNAARAEFSLSSGHGAGSTGLARRKWSGTICRTRISPVLCAAGVLLAQPFDASTCGRRAAPKASLSRYLQALRASVVHFLGVAQTGCCCIRPLRKRNSHGWIRTERNFRRSVIPGYLSSPYLSPDGRYAMVTVVPSRTKKSEALVVRPRAGTATPFTFGEGDDLYPAWSPDSGKWLSLPPAVASQEDIYIKPVGGGSSEQLVLGDEGNKEPDRWSADGRYILFDYNRQEDKGDRRLGLAAVRRPQALSRRRRHPGSTITGCSLPTENGWPTIRMSRAGPKFT